MAQQVLRYSEVKEKLDKLVENASDKAMTTYITIGGTTKAVLLNAKEYAITQATINVLSSDSTKEAIRTGKKQQIEGKTINLQEAKKKLNLE